MNHLITVILLLHYASALPVPPEPAPPPGHWQLSVQGPNPHSGHRIWYNTHFLGLLSSVSLEEVFSLVGQPYTVLPLGEYALEAMTVSGHQVLLHLETGDRYEVATPPPAPGSYAPPQGQLLDLQALGYVYVWGEAQGQDSKEPLTLETGEKSETTELVKKLTDFRHHMVLDMEGKYHLSWSLGLSGITFKMEVETLGYIGLGFSPDGGMAGADMVIAWVDDVSGEVHLTDRHCLGFFLPPLDASQDLTLVSGHQNETHTVVEFYRDFVTCDENDAELGSDTLRVIWAYHQGDQLVYHTPFLRGVESVNLQEVETVETLHKDHKVWEVRMEDQAVPHADVTTYLSKIVKVPKLTSKHSLIAVEPFIQPGSERFIDHMLLRQCHVPAAMGDTKEIFETYLGQPPIKSFTVEMPAVWHHCTTIHGWAVGTKSIVMPKNVGFPMGEEFGGTTYFNFEIHYENTARIENVVDSSGFRIIYTDEPREFDMAMLMLGAMVSITTMIPPRQTSFTTAGYCHAACTESTLPEEGVTIFSGFLHTHDAGRKIRVRHVRDGVELPLLFEDNHYDPNLEVGRVPNSALKLLPGDMLITECDFETSGNTDPIYGGLGREEEMCLTYLSYYPATNLVDCRSMPTFPTLMKSLGIETVVGNSFEQFLTHTFHDILGPKQGNLTEIIKDLSVAGLLVEEMEEELSDSSFYWHFTRQKKLLLKLMNRIRIEDTVNETVGDVIKNVDWKVAGKRMSKVLALEEHKFSCSSEDTTTLVDLEHSDLANFSVLVKDDQGCKHIY